MSEVVDLRTFWNNFWRVTSFGPKLRETARSQENFRSTVNGFTKHIYYE